MTQPDGASFDDLTLDALAETLASGYDDVTTSIDGDVTSYSRAGTPFARVSSRVLEVRLPEDIADAALRTRDTARLSDDKDWIRFTPDSIERHVLDRAEAWFVTAWRHVG